jgi:hypothetical protein
MGAMRGDGTEPLTDAFSEILGGVVLKGALFFSAEFSAPWGLPHRHHAAWPRCCLLELRIL